MKYSTLNIDLSIAELQFKVFLLSLFSTYISNNINDCKRKMSIMALVDGKKYSQEISKELFLVHLSQIYVNDIAFFIEKTSLRNHADESARFSIKKKTLL